MDFSDYTDDYLLAWAEICELRADTDLEGMSEDKKDLLYYVAETIYEELVKRQLLGG